jgi:hypothetical protein
MFSSETLKLRYLTASEKAKAICYTEMNNILPKNPELT